MDYRKIEYYLYSEEEKNWYDRRVEDKTRIIFIDGKKVILND
jgi:hypothetical protein